MNNQIQIFNNAEFGSVRTVIVDGEPWFVGKDVAAILGYSDTNKAIAMHVDDEDKKLNDKTSPSFGQRGTTLINESGLYSLILTSKLPKAKQFKRWVTSEILPTIRKTGSYSIQSKPDSYTINDPIARAERWIEEQKEKLALEQKIKEDKPKVDFANQVHDSTNLSSIGDFAKALHDENIHIGRNKLFRWLKDNKYLMQDNSPYQKYVDRGIFAVVESTYIAKGESHVGYTTKITGKGQLYITNKLRETWS